MLVQWNFQCDGQKLVKMILRYSFCIHQNIDVPETEFALHIRQNKILKYHINMQYIICAKNRKINVRNFNLNGATTIDS